MLAQKMQNHSFRGANPLEVGSDCLFSAENMCCYIEVNTRRSDVG